MVLVFINKSKIHFETYSQLESLVDAVSEECLSINQRYILKPIHNINRLIKLKCKSVYQ